SVGLGGDVNKSLKSSNLQRWGTLAFFYSSIKMLIKYTPPACTLRIRKTGEENWTEVNTSLINFFVCNAQFSGGGMHWAPNASLTADNFEIVHVKAISKWRLFFESHKVYSGNVSQMSGVTLYQGSEIQVIPEGYSTQELDGEIRDIEEGHIPKEFNYRLIPKAIPVNL
ncbi:MAG: hypothetical protein KDK45_09845, partial [Leptospiraceae bacterium]|nr:hypothetical protein [Leptospiraceae bacterium]